MSGYADYKTVNVSFEHVWPVQVVRATNEFLQEHKVGFLFAKTYIPPCKIVNFRNEYHDEVVVDPTVVKGSFVCSWRQNTLYCKNNAVDSKEYTVCQLRDNHRDNSRQIYTREVNNHPDSSQIFYTNSQLDFFMLVGFAKQNQYYALYCSGDQGLYIHPGVDHQPPIPVPIVDTDYAVTFYTEQSRAHNCIVFDSIDKLGQWLTFPVSSSPPKNNVLIVNLSDEFELTQLTEIIQEYDQIYVSVSAFDILRARQCTLPLISINFFVQESVRNCLEAVVDYGVLQKIKQHFFHTVILAPSSNNKDDLFSPFISQYCVQYSPHTCVVEI